MSEWLIDKSALVRLGRSADPIAWAERLERGLVRVCSATRLELGYSARSASDLKTIITTVPVSALTIEHFTPAVEERAIEIQRLLAERGLHRGPSLVDILIAATAELNRLVVLHVDPDFETISELTGVRVERLQLAAPAE
ncbi:PIN domain nuclease [Herbiconiux sp.]|uniref:PIN domain nuclease n=1 Tax=Herbiconiux sp. TaxID=1871186 RepID=UPI0025B82A5E|nr:PIN domain nuclease [Herbiconiux sp.]